MTDIYNEVIKTDNLFIDMKRHVVKLLIIIFLFICSSKEIIEPEKVTFKTNIQNNGQYNVVIGYHAGYSNPCRGVVE